MATKISIVAALAAAVGITCMFCGVFTFGFFTWAVSMITLAAADSCNKSKSRK